MIVSSGHDTSTSYSLAASLQKQILSSILLNRVGDGRTSYGSVSDTTGETTAAVNTYLVNGTLPANNTVISSRPYDKCGGMVETPRLAIDL